MNSENKLSIEREMRLDWRDGSIVVFLIIIIAVLYLPRMLPGTGYAPDTMKYHYIGAVLGISHPPGSPLYILTNWLIAQIPLGELAWRINFFSILCAALAVVFLYLIGREISRSRLGSALTAAALLSAAMFWGQSIIAEVYTFHAALLLSSAWLLLRWHRTSSRLDLGLAATLYGLSFGVHLMSWCFLPGWIALVFFGNRSILRRPKEIALVVGGASLGMSTYLYYAIRPALQPIYTEFQITGISTFLDYITGSYFRKYMFAYDAQTYFSERLPWLIELILKNIGFPLLFVCGIGLAAVFLKNVRLGVFVIAPILLSSLYATNYSVPDAQVFALPALYMLLVAAAAGFAILINTANNLFKNRWRTAGLLIIIITALAFERSGQFAENSILLDYSNNKRFAQYAEKIIETVEDDSTIVAGSDWSFHALAYYLWGKRVRPDDGLILKVLPPERCEETRSIIDLYLQRGPVYCTTNLTSCISAEDYEIEAWDFSRTLPEYLKSIPSGRLVLLAVQDEGTAGIKKPAWDELRKLGVLSDMRGRFRWSYAAALIRTKDGFAGIERSGEEAAKVELKRGEEINDGIKAPLDLSVISGGQLSRRGGAIIVDGIDYSRSNRGLQIVVFDAATGTPLERQVFDTHQTISLREFDFFKVISRKSHSEQESTQK